MTLTELNAMAIEDAAARLQQCCAAPRWARALAAERPFTSVATLRRRAAELWAEVGPEEQLEAFAAHPMIGDRDALRERFSHAHAEQGQVLGADEATLAELAELNPAYRERHGFTFIVRAAGRSAEEMLALLKTRIDRDTDTERAAAAAEQAAITDRRLAELFGDGS